jgi:UDPglucose 6-dehydrogenase
MKVTIIGTGYVGLTTAVTLAYIGHKVVGVEKDREKLRLIQSFKSPIYEPGLEELMELCKDNLTFTDDPVPWVSDSEVIMIAVGTPSKPNGQTDLRYVENAAREIAEGLSEGRTYTLVIKSTVPIGTNRRVAYIVEQVINARKPKNNIRVNVASNPEFLREGSALKDMLYPDRIVVGSREPESVDILRRLYRPILEQTFEPPPFLPRPEGYDLPPFITTDPISAEMIKYAANAFLAMKISFINEIASLCEKVGADVTEVARGIGLDPRIGPRFLEAGLGWGGSCFPKDTAALVAMGKELSCPMRLVEAAREVNYRQRERAVERLQEVLKGVRGRIIGILGLAFKPGTDDVRDSPSIDIIHMLLQREAHVRAHDPVAMDNARKVLQGLEVEFVDDPYEMAKGADALLLVTAWPQYRKLSLRRLALVMRTPILFDGRNFFEPEEAQKAGFLYLGIGR